MLDLAGVAGCPELLITVEADLLHVSPGRLVEVAGVEVGGILEGSFADRSSEGEAIVGVDVDLAHAVADAFLDFFDRHAVGLGDGTAEFVNHIQPFLGNGAGTMHHQVGVGDGFVNLSDAADRQHFAGGLAGEFVGAVAGADGDGQGIHLGLGHEVGGFGWVGQKLAVVEGSFEAMAIFGFALTGFERTQTAQLAFDADADGVGHVDHFLGDSDVVVVAGGGLGVGFQGAVHHHRSETVGGGAITSGRTIAVVLVHHHRNVRICFDSGQNQVAQKIFTGVLTGSPRSLQDHRTIGFMGGLHDRLDLLQVVHVEGRDAVAVLSGVV